MIAIAETSAPPTTPAGSQFPDSAAHARELVEASIAPAPPQNAGEYEFVSNRDFLTRNATPPGAAAPQSEASAEGLPLVKKFSLRLISSDSIRTPVFLAHKKWEGEVLEIGEDSFSARIIDLGEPDVIEEADFQFSEIQSDDKTLVQVGAMFYFSVGDLIDEYTTLRRTSNVRFRRLPNWSADAILDARDQVILEGPIETYTPPDSPAPRHD